MRRAKAPAYAIVVEKIGTVLKCTNEETAIREARDYFTKVFPQGRVVKVEHFPDRTYASRTVVAQFITTGRSL